MKASVFFFISFLLSTTVSLAQTENPITACPNQPNCVSTVGEKKCRTMQPLLFSVPLNEAKSKLKTLIAAFPRTRLAIERTNYLQYEFSTAIGNFVDDVAFYFETSTNRIHFRSSSRSGYGDMGANKRRMRRISRKWKKL